MKGLLSLSLWTCAVVDFLVQGLARLIFFRLRYGGSRDRTDRVSFGRAPRQPATPKSLPLPLWRQAFYGILRNIAKMRLDDKKFTVCL